MKQIFALLAVGILASCGGSSNEPSPYGPKSASTTLPAGERITYRMTPLFKDGRTTALTVSVGFRSSKLNRHGNYIVRETIPLARSRVAAYEAARTTGRGLERALTLIAIDVARATHCPSGPIGLAPEGTRQSFTPDQFASVLGSNANLPTPKGAVRKVPTIKISESGTGGTVRLTCDSVNPYPGRAGVTSLSLAEPKDEISPGQLRALASGKTHRSTSSQHGTQITYLAPGGTVYLWYPGNQGVVTGTWQIEPNQRNKSAGVICYQYRNAFNPVLRTSGGRSCITATTFERQTQESVTGDVFGLSSGQVPYVMRKADLSLAEVRAKASR